MGQFLSLWTEIQVSQGRMKYVQCWEEHTFSFPIVIISNRKEIVSVDGDYYYFTALLPIRTLIERFWPCTWCIFFLYPKNLDIIKYIKLTAIFILLVTPQKKTRSYGTVFAQEHVEKKWKKKLPKNISLYVLYQKEKIILIHFKLTFPL